MPPAPGSPARPMQPKVARPDRDPQRERAVRKRTGPGSRWQADGASGKWAGTWRACVALEWAGPAAPGRGLAGNREAPRTNGRPEPCWPEQAPLTPAIATSRPSSQQSESPPPRENARRALFPPWSLTRFRQHPRGKEGKRGRGQLSQVVACPTCLAGRRLNSIGHVPSYRQLPWRPPPPHGVARVRRRRSRHFPPARRPRG